MSSSEDEAQSPVNGASSSKDPLPPLNSDAASSDEELPAKKSKNYKRPRIEWQQVLRFRRGDDAIIAEEEMKHQIHQAHTKIMEDSRLVRLPGHVPGPKDVGMWKIKSEYAIDGGHTSVKWCQCPMHYRFGCKVQIKLYESPTYYLLEVRGEHNADSHAPEKERSKHLTVKQIQAIHTGVRMAPAQSAVTLRRNLVNFSPEKQINPIKIRNVRRQVAKFRAELTLEQLDNFRIDDSYGSLVRFSDAKWFRTLIDQHNDADLPFHFDLFEPFVIGRDLNPEDDIVYLNFSTIWHLCNFLRNIAAGWMLQICADGTYKVWRRGVAIYVIGVNSVPHKSNPVCWAVIPESESKEVCHGTWRAVQSAAFMMMKLINAAGATGTCIAVTMSFSV
jgi:hypothetical protein